MESSSGRSDDTSENRSCRTVEIEIRFVVVFPGRERSQVRLPLESQCLLALLHSPPSSKHVVSGGPCTSRNINPALVFNGSSFANEEC